MLCLSPLLNGANRDWAGTGTGDWTDMGNWAGAAMPGASDNAYIQNTGTAVIDGVTAATIGRIEVGGPTAGRKGGLEILNGGTLNVSGHVMSGAAANSLGIVTVKGAGSTLAGGNLMYVGRIGTGVLNILDGGHVTTVGNFSMGYDPSGGNNIPSGANPAGYVTINGSNSLLEGNNEGHIGFRGVGIMTLEDGGRARFSSNVYIGNGASGRGELHIGQGSMFTISGTNKVLYVGGNAAGMGLVKSRSALLAGSGVMVAGEGGSVKVSHNGTISAGDGAGAIGQLNIQGNLNLAYNDDSGWGQSVAGAATIRVDHNSTTADSIYVSNTVFIGESLNIDLSSLANITNKAILFTGSDGTIISAPGSSTKFTMNGLDFSEYARLADNLPVTSLTVTGSEILMSVNSTATNKHLVWTGATNNTWNLSETNWREAGGAEMAFLIGDSVTFGTLDGIDNVTIGQDVGQTVSQLAFIGNTSYTLEGNYTINGASAIGLTTGTSGKLLLGASGTAFNGTLTLTGNNSFARGTELHSGTLSIARVESLLRAPSLNGVSFMGSGANTPTLLLTEDMTFNAANMVSHLRIAPDSTGEIQIAPGKTVVITSGSGGTGAGIANYGQFSIAGGQVVFANNHADEQGGAINNGIAGVLTIDDAVFTANTSGSFGGAIINIGGGNLTVGVAATSTVTYAGNEAMNGGAVADAAAGGFLYVKASGGITTLDVAGHVTIGGDDAAVTGADSIASSDANSVITKTGEGTIVLNADNTHYTGTFNHNAGVVQFNNASALFGGAVNGSGTLVFNNTGHNLDFSSGDFHGTLRLQGDGAGASYDMDTVAASTRSILANSHLQLGTNGTLSIGSGSYGIGGLDFAGGALRTEMSGLAFTGTLKINGVLGFTDPQASKIIVDNIAPGGSLASLGARSGSVFSMDDAGSDAILLMAADSIAGHTDKAIGLYASNGVTRIDTAFQQTWGDYAIATFENMALAHTGSAGAGLYMDSVLTKVDIQSGRTLTLTADSTSDNTLNAIISGDGELAIDASVGAVTLGGVNTHSGVTRVVNGTLRLAAADALGDTSDLILSQNTVAELAGDSLFGNAQTIGAYTGAAGAKLSLGSGTLTVTDAKGTGLFVDNGATTDFGSASSLVLDGGTISGALTASADNTSQLTLRSNTLTISSANTDLNINTTVAADATLRLTDGGALGTGTIAFGGTLELAADGANTYFNNRLAGSGTIMKTGTGAMTVAQSNPGLNVQVNIAEGRLIADELDALGSSKIKAEAGGIIEFSGTGTLSNEITGDGMLAFSNNAEVTINRAYNLPQIEISSGAKLIASHTSALGGTNSKIHVTSNGALIINTYDNATRTFALGEITLTDRGRLRFTSAGTTFRRATIEKLLGSDGILEFNVDFKAVRDHAIASLSPVMPVGRAANHVTVLTAGSGTHGVYINSANPEYFAPMDGSYTPLIDTAEGDATRYHLVDVNGSPISHYESGLVALQLVKGGEDESTYTDNFNRWYLADSGLGATADAVIGSAAMAGKDWHYSLDALYLRMGEIRADLDEFKPGESKGTIWARGRSSLLKVNHKLLGRSFEQTNDGITAGADRAFAIKDSMVLFAGAFVDFGWVDRDFYNFGSGDSNSYGIGLYATMLHKSGWYGDLALKADRTKNSFDTRTVDNRMTHASYNSNAEGFSIEFGRRSHLISEWWFEPSIQMAMVWLNGANYDAKTFESSLPVKVDGSRSTQYRGGLRVGRSFGRWNPYAKIFWAKSDTGGGTVHAYTRDFNASLNEWRFECGFGMSVRLTEKASVYLDYEYATASAYERPWSVNLGWRTLW
ncbi:autotransporter outer membrane beta-barrel domain-containing protein [Ereboglobus luteus]|uniref:autotransporter outer membrane beta-barrel domain-containing protein n=1 Tax=Ereboglobus luteus TaxID=1796921 RepID=UPI00137538D6|nr:autotransporter outer membrane beta-barrel domain-containing protein [Ereboglobus luteus]